MKNTIVVIKHKKDSTVDYDSEPWISNWKRQNSGNAKAD